MELLNFPSMMRSRGPVRLHWELGGRGERVIQDLKKITTTQQGRWAYIAHLKFLQLKALKQIIPLIHNVVQDKNSCPTDIGDEVTHKYHRYDNDQEAKKNINKHLPIYVTQHVSGKFYMHLKPK
jgi:hypothetical protein